MERDLCENPMTQRYATIITGDDGREVVSAIGEFEGAAPQARLGRVEQVAPGVLIGMVRDAGGEFCFPQAGIDGRATGLVLARLRAGAAKPARAAKPGGATRPKSARKARKKSARSRKPARSAPKAAGPAGGAEGQAGG